MKILLITPPMTQLNTPYPATCSLTAFLKEKTPQHEVAQVDASLELALNLFSKSFLIKMKAELENKKQSLKRNSLRFLQKFDRYLETVESVVEFLQAKNASLAIRIFQRNWLPEGSRFEQPLLEENMNWAFGALGVQDKAKHLSTLYIDDLADVIQESIDERFGLSRYAEKLSASQPSFDEMYKALTENRKTLIEKELEQLTINFAEKYGPDVVAFTVPFPGNVFSAFLMAATFKKKNFKTKCLMGGGFVNTELRSLKEERVFEFFDYISLDDGERPFLNILEFIENKREQKDLLRTYVLENNKVKFCSSLLEHDIPFKELPAPTYVGLRIHEYLSFIEILNPMHRLWSDTRWNKLTLAHGCYWKKCSFCDISLDYIGRYEADPVDRLIDKMQKIAAETGSAAFHFTDEAAPPAVLKALSKKIIERNFVCTWWGNIRFDKVFDSELTNLMAKAGCIAVSGGLEVASDRLLLLMQKGVTVEQVARVTRNFRESGILVHAYLMYGFPTQTEQETVDSLERVRQLFVYGCIQSAYWHRFSATIHSPVGKEPQKYGIKVFYPKDAKFSVNDLEFQDPTECDHDTLGQGLKKALYNYMHSIGLEEDVRTWFEKKVPKAKVSATLIENALNS